MWGVKLLIRRLPQNGQRQEMKIHTDPVLRHMGSFVVCVTCSCCWSQMCMGCRAMLSSLLQAGHKALHTCTSGHAYAAMF